MRQIDVRHLGRPLVICCFVLDGAVIDPGPESTVETVVAELGDDVPERILLTHIHLDHAAATGALVRRWPNVEVWVHERGARHLVDPSRLMSSAARIWGDDMDRLWGEMVPVPEGNLRVLAGGERIGSWRVEYTPGHAWHHVSYLHEPTGTALVGDVAGVRMTADGPVLPPTPPPDIDLDAWHESLRTVAAWDPALLAITHFGAWEDVGDHVAAMHDALDSWGELARRSNGDAYAAAMREAIHASYEGATAQSVLQSMPPEMLWPGLDRYWASRQAGR